MSYRIAVFVLGSFGVFAAAPFAEAADAMPVKAPPATRVEAIAPGWSAAFASETRYFSWKGDRGYPTSVISGPGSGTQIYIPYALQLVGTPNDLFKVELIGRGGWVRSRQTTTGMSGEVSTQTDTAVSGTLTYLGLNGVQPFIALSTNLPTGRSSLAGSAANARMDPDLVEITSFGEGFNIGPTAGVNIPLLPSLVATFAAGYTWRGTFDRETSLTASPGTAQLIARLDPGDVATGTASIAYKQGPWSFSLLGSVSEETTTTEGGASLYKAGRRYLASAAVSHAWPEHLGVTTLTASIAHSKKNEVLFLGASSLATEPFNTNSNLYRVGLQHLWQIGSLWVGPTGSYLRRDSNAYDPLAFQFVPAKERVAAGFNSRFAATDRVTFNLRAEHIWTREDEKTAINGQQFSVLANAFVLGAAVPPVSSTGWQVSSGFNVRF